MFTQQDDWTFSLVVPSTKDSEQPIAAVHLSSAGGVATSVTPTEPPVRAEAGVSTDNEYNVPETTSLLSPNSDKRDGGWTFSSPDWSLSSRNLLKITFRPAWQALPEYTNISAARTCCRKLSCSSSCSGPTEMYSQVYTTQQVERVKELVDLRIRGLGSCRGVQLFLKHKSCPFGKDYVPIELRDALRRQEKLDAHCTNEWDREMDEPDSLPRPPWEQDVSDRQQYGPILTFAMPIDNSGPPLLWKVEMPPNPLIAVETYTMLDGCLDINDTHHFPTHIYINGYQSWSFSGSVVQGNKQPQSAMHDVFSRAFNHGGYAAPKANMWCCGDENDFWGADEDERPPKYKSDFFTCITSDGSASAENMNRKFPYRLLDETGGPALLVGWLSQHHQFGVVTANKDLTRVAMHASAGPCILTRSGKTDWAYAQLIAPHQYDEEPMVHYLHSVASYNEARPLQNGPLLTGWCSWYHYYENISAASLRENFSKLQALRRTVPTNVSVVDDGYMTAWGDWDSLKPGKFPDNGMKAVANDIASFGMRPGVWLAPFACDKHSQVAKQHPDWIIKNDQGRPSNSSNCGKFFYGLDATNPHVRKYVHSCVKRAVHEWGFNVLKIDFLYAACLEGNGKYDLSMTRAEAMHLALRTIRSAAGPDVFLIGCGCPIGTGIGFADGMRVSADTGPTWYPAFPLPWWDNGTLPSLRAMVRNSMSRAILGHRWWHNDPDCLLLGETTRLTDIEVASAASIVALTCGMLLLSDDLTKVSPSRINILTKIFPMTGATAVVLDLHNTNDGLPSLMRMWCTDRYHDEVASMQDSDSSLTENGENISASISTLLGRRASFAPDRPLPLPNERKRNCILVAPGMGTWTLLSVSNWLDEQTVVHVPSVALEAPPSTGWEDGSPCSDEGDSDTRCATAPYGNHVFAFWSGTYTWMPEAKSADNVHSSLSKKLKAHETEIFHLRAVTPNVPQYIGSDIHFSCGQEVQAFVAKRNCVNISLKSYHSRKGHIFLYIPRHDVSDIVASANGKRTPFRVIANTPGPNVGRGRSCIGRIISIPVEVHGDGSKMDGLVELTF